MEIINAKTITDEMEQHYGTTDPIEVGEGGVFCTLFSFVIYETYPL